MATSAEVTPKGSLERESYPMRISGLHVVLDGDYMEYHEEVETAKGKVTLIQFRSSLADP